MIAWFASLRLNGKGKRVVNALMHISATLPMAVHDMDKHCTEDKAQLETSQMAKGSREKVDAMKYPYSGYT